MINPLDGDACLQWQRPQDCSNSTCIEVAIDTDSVNVRDGKDPGGPVLRFTRAEWRAFVTSVRDGQFSVD